MNKGTYWIADQRQLVALAEPVRHDIVDRLTALGPHSAAGLAKALQRGQTGVYRHLQVLLRVGLIRSTHSQVAGSKRGRPAAIYEAVAQHLRFARAPLHRQNRRAMIKICRSVARQSVKDYQNAFDDSRWVLEGVARNQWFFRLFTAPSPERLRHINKKLNELMRLIWSRDPKPGPLVTVAWFMSPMLNKRASKKKR